MSDLNIKPEKAILAAILAPLEGAPCKYHNEYYWFMWYDQDFDHLVLQRPGYEGLINISADLDSLDRPKDVRPSLRFKRSNWSFIRYFQVKYIKLIEFLEKKNIINEF